MALPSSTVRTKKRCMPCHESSVTLYHFAHDHCCSGANQPCMSSSNKQAPVHAYNFLCGTGLLAASNLPVMHLPVCLRPQIPVEYPPGTTYGRYFHLLLHTRGLLLLEVYRRVSGPGHAYRVVITNARQVSALQCVQELTEVTTVTLQEIRFWARNSHLAPFRDCVSNFKLIEGLSRTQWVPCNLFAPVLHSTQAESWAVLVVLRF
jgi:hypothetical protein